MILSIQYQVISFSFFIPGMYTCFKISHKQKRIKKIIVYLHKHSESQHCKIVSENQEMILVDMHIPFCNLPNYVTLPPEKMVSRSSATLYYNINEVRWERACWDNFMYIKISLMKQFSDVDSQENHWWTLTQGNESREKYS